MPAYECPTCRTIVTCVTPEEAPYRPFCSERCKLIDLGHWLNGDYCITEPASAEESAQEPDDDQRDER